MSIDTKTIRDLHAKRGDHPWGSSFEHAAYQHMPELLDAYDRLSTLEAESIRQQAEIERLQDELIDIKALVDTGGWYLATAANVAEKALAGDDA